MAEERAGTPTPTPPAGSGISRARFHANIGLAAGLVLGFVLGLAQVTVAVRWAETDTGHPAYRVLVLGVVVFRYPEDGELYKMRPGAQVHNARWDLAWASALACGVLGWVAGYAHGRLTRRRT